LFFIIYFLLQKCLVCAKPGASINVSSSVGTFDHLEHQSPPKKGKKIHRIKQEEEAQQLPFIHYPCAVERSIA
jgi:hypothetical protein